MTLVVTVSMTSAISCPSVAAELPAMIEFTPPSSNAQAIQAASGLEGLVVADRRVREGATSH